MIKKLILTAVTTLSLLYVTVQAEEVKKCASEKKCSTQDRKKCSSRKKMRQKMRHSPFLIKHGLPRMMRMVMKNWDDEKLALNDDQKGKLLLVKKITKDNVEKLQAQIKELKKDIIKTSSAGANASELKEKVEKLAALRAEATMLQLYCIDNVKALLNEEQKTFFKEKRASMIKEWKTSKKCKTEGKCKKK